MPSASAALRALDEPVRFTWYRSPELAEAENLKIVDGMMAAVLRSVGRIPGMRNDVTAEVRAPADGERRPGSMLPLPARRADGRTTILWSALVLDAGERRVVVPELWDPGWLHRDLTRALEDLGGDGPLPVAVLEPPNGSLLPTSAFRGRWTPIPWNWQSGRPPTDLLLFVDGGYDAAAMGPIRSGLEAHLAAGGRILIVAADAPLRSLLVDGVLRSGVSDAVRVVNPRSDFRDLDTRLLELADRGELAALRPGDDPPQRSRGSAPAGRRILRAANSPEGVNRIPDPGDVDSLEFRNSGSTVFRLERGDGNWILISDAWRLPARGDRVEAFLSRLDEGASRAWTVSDSKEASDRPPEGGLSLVLGPSGLRDGILGDLQVRRSGGGVYVRLGSRRVLWPELLADEVSGDARYWSDRRLFDDLTEPIRAELVSTGRLFWRIHAENERWIVTDGRGGRTVVDSQAAEAFVNRLHRAESAAIAPGTGRTSGPLTLMVEDGAGVRREYRLDDEPAGGVTAESADGIVHRLNPAFVDFLLNGPIPES